MVDIDLVNEAFFLSLVQWRSPCSEDSRFMTSPWSDGSNGPCREKLFVRELGSRSTQLLDT